jgi:crossover junction endodeoxyribonuclease RuvC
MTARRQVLALDLAHRAGWALGFPEDTHPESGSVRFAKEGSSLAAVLSGCRLYLRDFLSVHPEVGLVVFESPNVGLHMRGRTNAKSIRMLIGLASVTEELLYTLGGYDVREAQVKDIRTHFLGNNKAKRAEAKELTIAKCRMLGWQPVDDNAADALAAWDYQTSLLRAARIHGGRR